MQTNTPERKRVVMPVKSRYSTFTQCPICLLLKTRRAFKGSSAENCVHCDRKEIPSKAILLHYYVESKGTYLAITPHTVDAVYEAIGFRILNMQLPPETEVPELQLPPKKLLPIRLPRLTSEEGEEIKSPEPASPTSEPPIPTPTEEINDLTEQYRVLHLHVSDIYVALNNKQAEIDELKLRSEKMVDQINLLLQFANRITASYESVLGKPPPSA